MEGPWPLFEWVGQERESPEGPDQKILRKTQKPKKEKSKYLRWWAHLIVSQTGKNDP